MKPLGYHANDDDNIRIHTHSAHAHGTHNQSTNQVAKVRLTLERCYKIQRISQDAPVGSGT